MHPLRLALSLWAFLVARSLLGQSADRSFPPFQCGFAGTYLPVMNRHLGGVGIQLLYQPMPRFGTGIQVVAARVRLGETFTYAVQDPRLTLLQLGWLSQLSVVRAGRVTISITGQASVLSNQLGDWAEKRYAGRGGYVPKAVATDVYLTLEPGLRTTCALSDKVALSGTAAQAFTFGTGTFSTAGQFATPRLAVGVQVLVPTRTN